MPREKPNKPQAKPRVNPHLKSKRPRRPDPIVQGETLVRVVTGTERANGNDLLESPELRRMLREAKAAAATRRKR